MRRIGLRYVYRHIDKAWYVGEHNRRYFLKMGVKEEDLEYVPHAIDNDRFKRTATVTAQAMSYRTSMNIPLSANVFLYAGKIKKEKGVFVLLRSFLAMHGENDHLLIVGSGKDLPMLKQMAVASMNVHFLSPQPQTNMPLIYSIADVCVLPSESDTWGLVLNEAMANGLAVIASDKCGGAIDLIDEGMNGFVFKAGDEKALAVILKSIATDPRRLKTLKENSLKKISDFSYELQAMRIESILNSSIL
jgi:glycosyltransferase involved in cell wall biosynthesis